MLRGEIGEPIFEAAADGGVEAAAAYLSCARNSDDGTRAHRNPRNRQISDRQPRPRISAKFRGEVTKGRLGVTLSLSAPPRRSRERQ